MGDTVVDDKCMAFIGVGLTLFVLYSHVFQGFPVDWSSLFYLMLGVGWTYLGITGMVKKRAAKG